MAELDYQGSYNRLFPMKMGTTSFLMVYILWMLSGRENLYGKQIVDDITTKLESNWKPSHGLVYPILRDLEKSGWVHGFWDNQESDKKTRRFYSISKEGREELEKRKLEYLPMFEASLGVLNTIIKDVYNR